MRYLGLAVFGTIFASVAAGNIAVADIQFGVFQGETSAGETCQLRVLEKYYDQDERHPLNERVVVELDGNRWELSHPAVVVMRDGLIRFDHSYFQQLLAQPYGAKGLVVNIDHDSEPHAAVRYTYLEDNYRDSSQSKKVVCSDLKKVSDL